VGATGVLVAGVGAVGDGIAGAGAVGAGALQATLSGNISIKTRRHEINNFFINYPSVNLLPSSY